MRAEIKTSISIVLIAVFSAAVFAGSSPQDDKDAPETLIKASRFLEEKPFGDDAKKMRGWAIKWIIETDKVSVKVCSLLLGVEKKYKYNGEVFGQYTIGMAAFKLANPARASDEDAAQLAGIESALTAYDAMVKEQPKARNAFLDDLVTNRGAGSLAQHVAANNCKENK